MMCRRADTDLLVFACMDLTGVIADLRAELAKVESAIAALERLVVPKASPRAPARRGRKSMGPEERQQVAERIRRYWAALRAKRRDGAGGKTA